MLPSQVKLTYPDYQSHLSQQSRQSSLKMILVQAADLLLDLQEVQQEQQLTGMHVCFVKILMQKGKLSSVTTFKMSDQILEASKYDQNVSVKLAGINDLIASEGKYHVNCFVKFTRQASKAKE